MIVMKRIYRLFIGVCLIGAALTSCHIEPVDPVGFEGEGIVLKLESGDMSLSTRADSTRPGDDDGSFNENLLGTSVDIFFFPEGATDATESVKNLNISVRAGGYVQIPVSTGDIYTIFGSTAAGSKAELYVIANYNGVTAIDHSRRYTLGEIKNLPLVKADWTTFPQQKFVMTGESTITLVNASANTPATGVVRMKRVAAKLTFRLTVADEIVVENITYDHDGNVAQKSLDRWHPIKDAMTVYLQYGMNYALLGGQVQKVPSDPKGEGARDSLYTYKPNKLVETSETKTRHRTIIDDLHQDPVSKEWILTTHDEDVAVPVYKTKFMQHTTVDGEDVGTLTDNDGPFYSYPVTWDPGVQTEPFIKLIIPWNNGSRTKYYYYKIPFSGTALEANNWYEITLDVQVLGGEDQLPVPLEATYKVVDWVPGTISESSTVAARYLSVPKTEWIMYNTNELKIPITSSHDVQIVGYTVKQAATTASPYAAGRAFTAGDKELTSSWIGSNPRIYNPFTNTLTGIDEATSVGTVYATRPNYNANNMNGAPVPATSSAASWFPSDGLTRDGIVIQHNLNNNTESGNYDVAPYYIRFRVQHKDDHSYYRDIIVEQRPAIVIEAQHNSDFGTPDYNGNTVNNGWAYVNGASTQSYLGRSNTNFNMYIIETSVLPTSGALKDFMLSDPRSDDYTATPGSAGGTYFIQAATVNRGNNQRLAYYYPAGTSLAYDDYIAPKFRIASSFGASPTMNQNDAIRRCASYQEDGYPAGRWRLPTVAEIKFMAQLTSDNYIPRLLGNTGSGSSYYWCNSTGYAVRIDNAGNYDGVRDPEKVARTENSNVRCVYDEWFWENTEHEKVTKTQFTWGDQKREDVVRTKAK